MNRTTQALLAAALVFAGCDSSDTTPTIEPVDGGRSTLAGAPAQLVADGLAAATLTATARDAAGRPLANRTAVFEVSGDGNQLSAAEATTGADGAATITVASTRAEAKTARVTIAGVAVAQTAPLTFVAGPPSAATSTLGVSPGTAPADGAAQVIVTATVLDAHGNAIAGLAVDFASTGGTLGAAQATTDGAGVAAVPLTSTVAGGVTVSASAGGVALGEPQAVSFTAGAAATLALVAQPAGGVAGEPLADLVLEARDATGNLVAFPAAVTVSLLSAPAGAVLGGTTTLAPAGSTATFAGLSLQRAGGYRLRVESGALQVDGAPFTVSAGPLAAAVVTAAPAGPVTAGAAFGATVELRDAFGNVVPSSASVSLALLPGGVLQGAAAVAASSGVATFAGLSIEAVGSYALVASSGPLSSAPSPSFDVAPAAAARLAFARSPGASATAGEELAPAPIVTVLDAFGNPVAAGAHAISLALQGGAAGAVLGGTAAATSAGGAATFAGLSVDRAGSGYRLAASAAGLAGAVSADFAIVPGPLASVVVTASPAGPVAAGAAFGATVELRDAFGNVVPSGATVSLALSPGGTLLGGASAAAVAGVATFAGLSVEAAGTYALVATASAIPSAPGAAFDVVAAAAARLVFTQSPSGPAAAGAVLAPPAIVAVQDAFGNPVVSTGDLVAVALQGGNPAAALGGTVAGVTVLGEITFADLTVDLAGAGYTLVASSSGLTDAVSAAFAIASGAADATTSAVAAAPTTQTAGEDVVLTATVRDFFGNPVEGATVLFATTAPDSSFVQPPATDADGVAIGHFTSTRAGAATVTGSAGGPPFAGTASVTFQPAAPSAVASTLVAAPESADADGTTAITLTATVKDAFGNAVPGALVTLASDGDASFVQPGPTDAGGVSSGSIRSTVVGVQQVAASAGGSVIAGTAVLFLTLDPDGDGIPKPDDAFPADPTRFAAYQSVPLAGLGGTFSVATAINGSNLVVGLSEDGSGLLTGARWVVTGTSASAGQGLAPLIGNAYSAAYAVDASGAVVGESERGADYVAVIWEPGATLPIDLRLGGFTSPSAAYGISGDRIVGEAGQGGGSAAVLWAHVDAVPVALPSLGGDRGAAYAIAGSLVVGESTATAGGPSVGAVWTLDGSGNPGPAVPLAPLAGHVASIALGVDAATGRIVGESESATGEVHAVAWTVAAPAAPVDLGSGSAQGVNGGGRVAGAGGVPVGPIVWDVRNPALLEGVITGPFQFAQGTALNGANVVVGVRDGEAFAAVPVSP
jgi:protocatechuate 3,4-dioxygenase beta subunit